MDGDQCHFNVSLIILRDKVARQCPQATTFLKRIESRSARPNRVTGGSDADGEMNACPGQPPGGPRSFELPGFLPGTLTDPPAKKERVKKKKKKKEKKKACSQCRRGYDSLIEALHAKIEFLFL